MIPQAGKKTKVKGKFSYCYSDLANLSYPLKNTEVVMKVTYTKINTDENGKKTFEKG